LIAYHFSKWKITEHYYVLRTIAYPDAKVWEVLANRYREALLQAGMNPSGKMRPYSGLEEVAGKLQRRVWQDQVMSLDLLGREQAHLSSPKELFKFLLKELRVNLKGFIRDMFLLLEKIMGEYQLLQKSSYKTSARN
jgi:hypothetical protein